MARFVVHPDVRPILFSLGLLSAYLVSNAMLYGRTSPPLFFTVALGLAAASLRPTLHVAFSAAALAIFATVFLALDHIHGDCYYEVLIGQTHPRPGIQTDLQYFQRCVQSAQAWWIMLALSVLWSLFFLYGLFENHQRRRNRIKLANEAEEIPDAQSPLMER